MFSKTLTIAALLATVSWCMPAGAAEYQFGYQISGHPAIKPLQVFDDGERTYLQFPSRMSEPPSILTVHGSETKLHVPFQHGPYWVIDTTAARLELRMRSVKAFVRLASEPAMPALTERVSAASFGVVDPTLGGSPQKTAASDRSGNEDFNHTVPFEPGKAALSTKARAAVAEAMSSGRGEVIHVKIVARDDELYGEGVARARGSVLRQALQRYQVPADRIVVVEGEPKMDANGKAALSDIVVTRALVGRIQPAQDSKDAKESSKSYPYAAVRQAVQQIQAGFSVLQQHGILDQGRVDSILSIIRAAVSKYVPSSVPPTSAGIVGVTQPGSKTWVIEGGQGAWLRDGLTKWAGEVGYEVQWLAPVDYPVKERITAVGSFNAAAVQAIALTKGARIPLTASFEGNKVVVKGN